MQSTQVSAQILQFQPRARAPRVFTWRERVALNLWAATARRVGLVRVTLHGRVPEGPAGESEFVLVHHARSCWAAYGIGVERGRWLVWRPGPGDTIGSFDDLDTALAAVIAHRTGGSLPLQV